MVAGGGQLIHQLNATIDQHGLLVRGPSGSGIDLSVFVLHDHLIRSLAVSATGSLICALSLPRTVSISHCLTSESAQC